MLREWSTLPDRMKNAEVKKYYDSLVQKKSSHILKRCFDIIMAGTGLVILVPLFIVVGVLIKSDTEGPVFFRQTRITRYYKEFRIFKFRTMTVKQKQSLEVTSANDSRITKTGKWLRKSKIDELPQLINVLLGDMSFVGTRPEVPRYVEFYTNEMYATLLMPAGITSTASVEYRNEEHILSNVQDVEAVYRDTVLPSKMKYNLKDVESFSVINDLVIIIKTMIAIIR